MKKNDESISLGKCWPSVASASIGFFMYRADAVLAKVHTASLVKK
jgi:hypothetical protein